MALLTVVEPVLAGTDPAFVAAAAAGDEFPADDHTTLHVVNSSGASIDVTLTSQTSARPGLIPDDQVVAVPAGEQRDIRLSPSSPFKDADGRCQVTYSSETSVTVAVTRSA